MVFCFVIFLFFFILAQKKNLDIAAAVEHDKLDLIVSQWKENTNKLRDKLYMRFVCDENNNNNSTRRSDMLQDLGQTLTKIFGQKFDVNYLPVGRQHVYVIEKQDLVLDSVLKLFISQNKLYDIRGSLTVTAGIDVSIVLNFGEESDSEDGSVAVELFSKNSRQRNFVKQLDQLLLQYIRTHWLKLKVRWSKSEGAYGGVDHTFEYGMDFADPVYLGSDGRLEATFSLMVITWYYSWFVGN